MDLMSHDFIVIINDYFLEMLGGGGVMFHCTFIPSRLSAVVGRSD